MRYGLAAQRRDQVAEMDDGFGQSLIDDVRFLWRFRVCRAKAADWRHPTDDERQALDADPLVGRFGDFTEAVARVDGRNWSVRSRIWHGWPDPAEFVFFARNPDGLVWCARDFDRWPGAWRRPQHAN